MKIDFRLTDCMELLSSLPDESVDCIITDPPFRMTKRGKSCRPNYMHDNMDESLFDYDLIPAERWFKECYRVLGEETHFYVFTNVQSLKDYLEAAEKTGFKLHNVLSMIKDTKMPNRWYLKYTELVLFFRKGKAKPINDMTSRDYFMAKTPTKKTGKVHITQKPLDFVELLVTNSSNEGETILDPFAGSCTTGIACMKNNRNFIGSEIDPKFYEIAKRRLTGSAADLNVDAEFLFGEAE